MNDRHYEHYKASLARGQPAQAALAIERFIASFSSLESRIHWVRWFLGNERWEHRIRHEIYEHLVFPVLLHGYRAGDLWSLRWLIRTLANVYTREQLWAQLDHKAEIDLREELMAQVPEDARARRELVDCYIEIFRNHVHEWPEAILYGHNSATAGECLEILAHTARVRQLDIEQRHHALLDEVVEKVHLYQQRMKYQT
jgi:hypothetical protein